MIENQKLPQPFSPEKNGNGKHTHSYSPIYAAPLQENQTEPLNLRQLLAVGRRRAVAIGTVAVTVTATVWFSTSKQTPEYEGKFRLLVEPVTAESKLTGLTQATGVNANLQESGLDYQTLIQVLQSPELMAPIIQQVRSRYPDISSKSLLDKLTISRFQETKILEVRYRDGNLQKIQFVLQQLSREYLKYSLQERQTNLRQGIQFVDEQLPQLQMRVNSIQREQQRFRQQYNFIEPEIKAQQLSEQFSHTSEQRLDTKKQIAEARTIYAELLKHPDAFPAEAPLYQKLLSQLRDVESQIAGDLVRFREDSPVIEGLQQKRENLLPLLHQEAKRALESKLAEMEKQISVLEVRDDTLVQAENSLNRQLKQLPTLARQYTDLQRELKIANESLNRFLEKRESLQIETAQREVPWQQIAPPELIQDPISPDLKRNLILGVLSGILGGIGAAVLAEKLDNVFHSPNDFKELTQLPLLGMIPFHKKIKRTTPAAETVVKKKGSSFVFHKISQAQNESTFSFFEAFRSLHTNIGFLSSDTPIHSLAISSSAPADGKSTVAVNLAQAAASMGQKVLLVDADLRLPQIHTMLNLSNEQGLSNAIITNVPLSEVIQRSPMGENLFILTAGQIPPDPTKLIASKKMQKFVEQLRQEFDFVIYDTPPLLGLADSGLLATYTDGIVLIVRVGKTDKSVLRQALDGLKLSRSSVLGVVANGIRENNGSFYNYYSQYHKGLLKNLSNKHEE